MKEEEIATNIWEDVKLELLSRSGFDFLDEVDSDPDYDLRSSMISGLTTWVRWIRTHARAISR